MVHSYRHRYGLVGGDPAYQDSEDRLAAQPRITVASIILDGSRDTVQPAQPREQHEPHFTDLIDYRCLDVGHNPAQENPTEFADAITDLHVHLRSPKP